ncbi:Lipid A core - O-antigen ligase and related enzyme [Hahella chejuensis KCTC 2396]|uniref:Lipid A core-O-antigen ligase and related enzyme n=1 Tax=Hahella chejuensis (strain KCTC 2396) TaxID=349521 RepID=Q2SIL2_HAHCH|nr:O-antigen ligase family protein [Hahella chejuensis]ABC29512.1 Lipid A core - O-antigen ligase and related enzyme [Hahella chejuensis KCTC 2396]
MNFPQLESPGGAFPKKKAETSIDSDMERLYSMDLKYYYHTIRAEGIAFIGICGYLFFEYVRPQSIYNWLDVLPWVPVCLLTAIMGILFFEKKKIKTAHPLNKLMVAYFLVVLLSSAFSQYSSVSFDNLWKFSDWFIIYFLIVKIVNTPKRFFIFFLSFLIYSLKMSQHGFISWASRGFGFASWGVTGAPGWFHNSGEVGIQMAIYVPLAVAFVMALKSYWNKIWKYIFFFMPFSGTGTIIASSSRGALVGLAASGLMALSKTKYLIRTLLAVTIIGSIIWYFVPDESKARFQSSGEDKTSLHRMERWQHGWETLNNYPLLGVGHDAWTTFYPRNFTPEEKGSKLVHNIFVQCGSELGYSGLFVLFLLLFVSFKTNRTVRKQAEKYDDKFYYYLSYGMDLGLIGLLISASFVTVLYYPFLWIHFALTTTMHNSWNVKVKLKQ